MRTHELCAAGARLEHPTRDDEAALLAICAELAPRIAVAPQGYPWWCQAVSGTDPKRPYLPIAELAREIACTPQRLVSGLLTEAQHVQACAILSEERDRMYGHIISAAREFIPHDRAMFVAMAHRPEEDVAAGAEQMSDAFRELGRARLAEIDARLAIVERAASPLEPPAIRPQTGELRPDVIVRAGGEGFYAAVQCAECSYTWRPRSGPQPKKCPRCQMPLDWSTATPAALPAASD